MLLSARLISFVHGTDRVYHTARSVFDIYCKLKTGNAAL